MKPKSWYDSINVAIEGILYAAKTQKHLRWHFVSAALIILLALYFGLDKTDFVALSLAVVVVLVAEIFNTAIEAVVDLISKEYNPIAKVAKDTAAGAVFTAAFGAAVIGFLILYPYVAKAVTEGIGKLRVAGENIAFMAIIVAIIAVIIAKAYIGKGRPLEGGMPSGHAATAFAVWVAVLFLTSNALIGILVFILAVMVAHSRIALGIHSAKEVIFGALLGGLITLFIFLLFL